MVERSLILSAIVCCLVAFTSANSNECKDIGDLKVFYDPSCSTNGGAGCNAGGQGQNCRFCGGAPFPACPKPTTTGPPTSPTTRTTKAPTTPRSTTTRDPNQSTPERPNPGQGTTEEPEYNDKGELLIFSDEFETLDLKKWKHDLTMSGGGNWEFQLYHNNRTNSFVKDGALHINPTLTEDRIGAQNLGGNNYRMDMWGGSIVDQCTGNNFYGCERTAGAGGNIINPIQSAKITTQESFSFKYGRLEVRAKLPRGDWLWPAIWLLPRRNAYGMWPASGEIDVMEGRGNVNYPEDAGGGINSFGSTLHWGVDWSQNQWPRTHSVHTNPTPLTDDFHTYGLYWTKERLYTYIDDEANIVLDIDLTAQPFFERGQFPASYDNPWQYTDNVNAPFDQEFYIVINLAVGGTANYFMDGIDGKPWSSGSSNAVNEFYRAKDRWLPTWDKEGRQFLIDSVKVWALADN